MLSMGKDKKQEYTSVYSERSKASNSFNTSSAKFSDVTLIFFDKTVHRSCSKANVLDPTVSFDAKYLLAILERSVSQDIPPQHLLIPFPKIKQLLILFSLQNFTLLISIANQDRNFIGDFSYLLGIIFFDSGRKRCKML